MRQYIPSLQWLAGYQREWMRADLFAGLTVAAVVIPKAMAYATIAGLPVEVGIYTAFVPLVIYALLGTSRPLSTSTTTTIAILVGTELAIVAHNADAATLLTASTTLAVLVGAFLVLASLLRIGFIADYISEPVLVGFKAGIGLVIVVDQIPKLLGVHFDKGSFLNNVTALVQHLPDTSIPTLLVGLAMLAILLGLEKFVPRAPAPLVAVAVGISAMVLLGLQSQGVATVGRIPEGLPSITLPDMALVAKLWPSALGIALMSFTESTAAARAFAARGEPRSNADQELLATGLSNIGGGLLGPGILRPRGPSAVSPVPAASPPPAAAPAAVEPLPVLGAVPEFTLTDQRGRSVSEAELRGRPWVASFIFTRCGLSCPRMVSAMKRVKAGAPEDLQIDPDSPP